MYIAYVVVMFPLLLPFRDAMFQGKATLLHFLTFTMLSALMCPFVVLLHWLSGAVFEWRLAGNTLVKKRGRPPYDDIARIDLRQVTRFRAGREVPFVGKTWTLHLTMDEVVDQPPVLFEFLGMKVTGRGGLHRSYYLYFLSRQDKDEVVSAIESAGTADLKAAS